MFTFIWADGQASAVESLKTRMCRMSFSISSLSLSLSLSLVYFFNIDNAHNSASVDAVETLAGS